MSVIAGAGAGDCRGRVGGCQTHRDSVVHLSRFGGCRSGGMVIFCVG